MKLTGGLENMVYNLKKLVEKNCPWNRAYMYLKI